MNFDVLYHFLSSELKTHIRLFNPASRTLIREYTVRKDIHDLFINQDPVLAQLIQPIRQPQLNTINDLITYLTVPLESMLCLIGPVSVCADCKFELKYPLLLLSEELLKNVPVVSSNYLIRYGVFLYNLFAENLIDFLTCFNFNCTSSYTPETSMTKGTQLLFYHEEYGTQHNPYDAEKREMLAIENGDINQLRLCWEEQFAGKPGMLSSDPLRNAKYLCIINIALSARAAVRGGVPFELAYTLSDAYCQQIDKMAKSGIEFESFVRNIQITYVNLVAQQKGISSAFSHEPPMIARAKEYIFSNLHGKITVNDVARVLNTHPNYLGRAFHKTEGITIHDYILREKIYLAKNMLTYSNYTCQEIASYLSFSSQSHLGSIFKKFTGMTLKQYRDAYHKY